MMALGEKDNLFHKWDVILEAISKVRRLKFHAAATHRQGYIGLLQVWPLQLIYHDIAWYLIYEYYLAFTAVGRVNRFYCKILLWSAQHTSLQNAHKLIEMAGVFIWESQPSNKPNCNPT